MDILEVVVNIEIVIIKLPCNIMVVLRSCKTNWQTMNIWITDFDYFVMSETLVT